MHYVKFTTHKPLSLYGYIYHWFSARQLGMCCLVLSSLLLTSCGGGGSGKSVGPVAVASKKLQMGAISYWSTSSLYDQLPSGSIAVVNPSNGILTGQTSTVTPDVGSYASIVTAAAARNVSMLGYVPTGYFDHTCNIAGQCQTLARINAQVQAYFQNMPNLAGIFFDEASPKVWTCSTYLAEYQQLRAMVQLYSPQAKVAFNAGFPDTCTVDATAAGEILALFEGDLATYASQAGLINTANAAAVAKGVIPWHLVYSVSNTTDLATVLFQAASSKTTLVYATDLPAGSTTWGALPTYWTQELSLLGY